MAAAARIEATPRRCLTRGRRPPTLKVNHARSHHPLHRPHRSARPADRPDPRLAACVSVVPGLRSFYHWEGDICDDSELLLLIKTRREFFEPLAARLHDLHPYEVPEIVALEATAVAPDYLAWLLGTTGL
jgi:periplasmic divalent cation tolerance protein